MSRINHFKHLKIQLEAIQSATNNFADTSCIGIGGYGKVYKGEIFGHKTVAFKRLVREHGQGEVEFWKEVMMLSLYKHKNIISLLGYCDDNDERILAYEYAPKRSLDLYLNNSELTWVRRLKICIGAAHGLAYLHSSIDQTQHRLLHRDIKSSNILLDNNWNAKISDFGLSKLGPANKKYSYLFSNPVGTLGYYDPLYAETGLLTKESDVYSFGVVLFEVLCGRLCWDYNQNQPTLIGSARLSYEQNTIGDIIYGNMKDEINLDSLKVFTEIAYQCLKRDREERPLMTDIVRALESALQFQKADGKKEFNEKKNFDGNDTKTVGDEGPVSVVLKLNLHCETCATKITECVQKFKGVETVKADLDNNTLIINGKVDPVRIMNRVVNKTHRKVELLNSSANKDDRVVKNDDDNPLAAGSNKRNAKGVPLYYRTSLETSVSYGLNYKITCGVSKW